MGFGSSAPCVPLAGLPAGTGYVQVAARELRARGFTVTLTNLEVPAMVISRRIQDLGTQYGRTFSATSSTRTRRLSRPQPRSSRSSRAPTTSTRSSAALGGAAGGTDQVGYINSQIQAFGPDFATLVRTVRERAPGARLVVLNLPNMAGMPLLANASMQQRRAEQMLSVGMTTHVINPPAAKGVLVVDLMCDPGATRARPIRATGSTRATPATRGSPRKSLPR